MILRFSLGLSPCLVSLPDVVVMIIGSTNESNMRSRHTTTGKSVLVMKFSYERDVISAAIAKAIGVALACSSALAY